MNKIFREEAFFSPTPPPRIIGTEMEYTVDYETLCNYSSLLYNGKTLHHDFLPNGARLYVDGENLEYCSAESLGPLDAAAADHAGMPIVKDIYSSTTSREKYGKEHVSGNQRFIPLRRSGGFCGVFVEEDGSVSSGYDSMGYHENLLTVLSPEFEQYRVFEKLMYSFLTTRHIWEGAGMVLEDGTLELSQKLFHTHNKELMRTHTDREKLGHLKKATLVEIRTADVHMLPFASFMGLGVTSLVLRLVEQGVIGPHNIKNWAIKGYPINEATRLSTMSYDDFDAEITLENGEQISVATYQRRLAELAVELTKEIALPKDEVKAANEWLKIMLSIEASGLEDPYLLGRVEHVTKHALMEHIARRKGKELEAMQRVAVDLSFTTVDQKLARGALKLFGDEAVRRDSAVILERADRYVTHAPKTRARARGGLIKTHGRDVKDAGWNFVKVGPKLIKLKDPYDPNPRTVWSRSER